LGQVLGIILGLSGVTPGCVQSFLQCAGEVITSVQPRRSWSRAKKERIVDAAMEPGAVASEVARAAGIHTSQLFRWRQQLCERTQVPAAFSLNEFDRLGQTQAAQLLDPLDSLLPCRYDVLAGVDRLEHRRNLTHLG
jgi:hypothetical protein